MKYSLTALALALAITVPGVAFAANQGTLGTSSSGDFRITLTVTDPNDTIEITGLNDITFDYALGESIPAASAEPFCVYATQASQYDLTISAGILTNGSENIDYQIDFADLSASGQTATYTVADAALPATTLTGLVASDTQNCPVSNTAQIDVTLLEAPLTAENTSATITLTVAPS